MRAINILRVDAILISSDQEKHEKRFMAKQVSRTRSLIGSQGHGEKFLIL